MSDVSAELPAYKASVMWWNEGEWQPIPSGMLSTETSSWVLAINDAEYPELSELVRYADDVDGYLEMLGISEATEGEELMGMDE